MNREETIAKLNEGQKLPHADLSDIRYIPKGISNEKLAEYLKDFVKPTGKCWLFG